MGQFETVMRRITVADPDHERHEKFMEWRGPAVDFHVDNELLQAVVDHLILNPTTP